MVSLAVERGIEKALDATRWEAAAASLEMTKASTSRPQVSVGECAIRPSLCPPMPPDLEEAKDCLTTGLSQEELLS